MRSTFQTRRTRRRRWRQPRRADGTPDEHLTPPGDEHAGATGRGEGRRRGRRNRFRNVPASPGVELDGERGGGGGGDELDDDEGNGASRARTRTGALRKHERFGNAPGRPDASSSSFGLEATGARMCGISPSSSPRARSSPDALTDISAGPKDVRADSAKAALTTDDAPSVGIVVLASVVKYNTSSPLDAIALSSLRDPSGTAIRLCASGTEVPSPVPSSCARSLVPRTRSREDVVPVPVPVPVAT